MPILEWIGKKKVVNHHLDVPYRILEKKYTYSAQPRHSAPERSEESHDMTEESPNKIIHGDNLEALKALLPEYEGKIDCIYIDPPYNTGNENWVYNDNVNDPKIKKWLGEVVGKEGEDLSRHDKWLCMMYPRLKLLQKLLSGRGAIFISIDDNEQANLKLLCDEIFGAGNFVAIFPWRKRTAKSDVPHGISQDCEYVLCYAKSNLFTGGITGGKRKYYETEDFPEKPWRFHDLTKQTTIEERPNSNFTIINPKNGAEYPVNPLRSWAITKETFQQYYDANRIIFPGDYPFLSISKPVLRYWKEDDDKKAGSSAGLVPASTYFPKEVGMTQDGTKEITEIFGEKKFQFPKPSALIQYLIEIATSANPDALILDSFAGSGTTAHAVLNMNKKDGGHRKFILIEMMDYADTITAERVKRVGGDFSYYELGPRLLLENGFLNEEIPVEKIYEYIWFTETQTKKTFPKENENYFLGKSNGVGYWFYYEKDAKTVLTLDFLKNMGEKCGQYIVYADVCLLDKTFMQKNNIVFKKIPRDIQRF